MLKLFFFLFIISFLVLPITAYGATCDLRVLSDPPDFRDVNVGQQSIKQTIEIRNTGDDTGSLHFSGTAWKDSNNNNIMTRDSSRYSFNQGDGFNDMISVPANDNDIISIDAKRTIFMYIKVLVDLIPLHSGFFGEVKQDLTLSLTC